MRKMTRLGQRTGQLVLLAALVSVATAVVGAEDWPYYRGKAGLGLWQETGILETFPAEGLASRGFLSGGGVDAP